MKKVIILFGTIVFIILIVFFYNYIQYQREELSINNFNQQYLEYNKDNLYGTDITTVINKAVNNNEKYKIQKDENGLYKEDENYSIKIYINLEEEGSIYPMESFYKVGITDFTKYFGELKFKCIKTEYKENGRISTMYFKAINY